MLDFFGPISAQFKDLLRPFGNTAKIRTLYLSGLQAVLSGPKNLLLRVRIPPSLWLVFRCLYTPANLLYIPYKERK